MIDLVTTGWFWIGYGLYVLGMYLAAPTIWGILGAVTNSPISIPEAKDPANRVLFHVFWGVAVVMIAVSLACQAIDGIIRGLSRVGHDIAEVFGFEEKPSR